MEELDGLSLAKRKPQGGVEMIETGSGLVVEGVPSYHAELEARVSAKAEVEAEDHIHGVCEQYHELEDLVP